MTNFLLSCIIKLMNEFMKEALKEAKKAERRGEVPIGAVIVLNNEIISRGFNNREKSKCSINHAEIIAIKKACKKIGDWRLEDCEMYVTLEPCLMCLGAILNSRIKAVYFGAKDNKSCNKEFLTSKNNSLNHNLIFEGGIMEDQCSSILKVFFQNARK